VHALLRSRFRYAQPVRPREMQRVSGEVAEMPVKFRRDYLGQPAKKPCELHAPRTPRYILLE